MKQVTALVAVLMAAGAGALEAQQASRWMRDKPV